MSVRSKQHHRPCIWFKAPCVSEETLVEATRLCGGEGKLSMNTHGRKQHMAIYGLDMDSIGLTCTWYADET